ncbi:MAG: polynucleotide adenylyltransferase PcnB [Moraxella sp.]|uniref:polynucleotide adenylyltransferase PcnB n=1 Tax=Moraxella sp. TaxID=479 RepID=UPI0026DA937A|nr:polynucleotide adenylyltransferase PcnB [Moraxella sp.]MDO4449556.1 polynucleotide adenylyltransferase PcnB [Moraxella sp.]
MATRLPKNPKTIKPTRHSAKSLGLSVSHLPRSIVEVVSTLTKAGFEAYIVGGGVRDSLLGLAPKDFDAVTNARPHEIKAVFGGRCRIIGRRFQLAHVYSGRELIEVATFRAPPKDDTHTTDDGMITRDNVWGTIEQDFARRDFSINALYYQPIKGEVLDFCGAIDDIKNGTLRLLGDAKVRVEEDPVRLLRALRFKAKLGFNFDDNLAKQFNDTNWALLEQVSAHRLYDESQKMFCGGYLAPLLPLLFQHGAMTSLMHHAPTAPTALMNAIAVNTDKRIAKDLGVNGAFFYAVLLWENYLHALAKFKKQGLHFFDAQTKALAKVMNDQRTKTAIPKFAEEFIAGIWLFQPKLVNPKLKEIATLATHAKFRAGFDFLLMRESFDDCVLSEPTSGMGAWWQQYQEQSETGKAVMIEAFGNGKGVPTTRRNRRARVAFDAPEADTTPITTPDNPPTPRPRQAPIVNTAIDVPMFAPVTYSEADFLRLLANDEPYIPAQRYRKREPSSTLSIKERQDTEDDLPKASTDNAKPSDKPKKAKKGKSDKVKSEKATPKTKGDKAKSDKAKAKKAKKAKADKADKSSNKVDKPKKRKKSNAKPRAGE